MDIKVKKATPGKITLEDCALLESRGYDIVVENGAIAMIIMKKEGG